MASLVYNPLHVVFAVKDRQPVIPPELDEPLQQYLRRILSRGRNKLIVCRGGPDHRHALILLNPAQTLTQVVRRMKASSSGWLRERFDDWPGWQKDYAAFALSPDRLAKVRRYILNQRDHHKARSLKAELEWMKADWQKSSESSRERNKWLEGSNGAG